MFSAALASQSSRITRQVTLTRRNRKSIRFRGKNEPVIETLRVRARNYFVLEKLSARGAYRVFDPHAGPNGDYRALYRIPSDQTTRQKIEVLKRFSGPNGNRNFPSIVDYVRDHDTIIVVLAWVAGTNLREYLKAIRERKTPRPSPSETVRLMRGMAHGLGHFHRRLNVVHGDISPANLVLTSGTKQLIAVDFGSAWPVERAGFKDDGDGATLLYAAPERVTGSTAADFRADMFSLAIVAFELLTLELPFDGLGGQAGLPALREKAMSKYKPPSEFGQISKQLPRETMQKLDEVIRTSLAFDPEDRYLTRDEWLVGWDELHDSFRKGTRLNSFERVLVGCVEIVVRAWERVVAR